MKNLSTGTGLALLAGAIVAWPVLDRLVPNANAVGIGTTATSAVVAAATAQAPPAPTIVWYSVVPQINSGTSPSGIKEIFRAWSDGRIEVTSGQFGTSGTAGNYCTKWFSTSGNSSMPLCNMWQVVSDPAQGLTFDADLNFDEAVNGDDLGMMLAKWGPAPRNPVPPSDCPLALINP